MTTAGPPLGLCERAGETPVWMTCVRDGREHAVAEIDVVAGLSSGLYRAVCDHVVLSQALASPCGVRCPRCATNPRSPARSTTTTHPLLAARRYLGWIRRVTGPH